MLTRPAEAEITIPPSIGIFGIGLVAPLVVSRVVGNPVMVEFMLRMSITSVNMSPLYSVAVKTSGGEFVGSINTTPDGRVIG